MTADRPRPIAFLFLGETLLIPHLWPLADALATLRPDQPIDLWVATSVHEALLGRWSAGRPNLRLRRAPGFRIVAAPEDGHNPPLPAKMPMLARLLPRLFGVRAVVCAEQTSLWLPRLLPRGLPPFIKTSHGVGSMSARDDPRRRAAALTLVPSALERDTYLARGFDPARIVATGYLKSSFRHRTPSAALFDTARPVLLYTPHWQRQRSSWWSWGREIVAMLAEQREWNVILAPHQRLFEVDPAAREVIERAATLRHVHADSTSFAMVDGSYTAAADLYLGDTSSQVIEYLARPRPCVFLNAQTLDWRATTDHGFWECGEVVDNPARIAGAIATAVRRHSEFELIQVRYAADALGPASDRAPVTAAEAIIAHLRL